VQLQGYIGCKMDWRTETEVAGDDGVWETVLLESVNLQVHNIALSQRIDSKALQ